MTTTDCHNCGRVVADGLELCALCADSLRRELLQVPGLVSDMTITRARLDRMSRAASAGRAPRPRCPCAWTSSTSARHSARSIT
ncbi:hypothetical protein GS891_12215 [Rhodococcus hoagii]|nr:hypothetical protein [Prescottella equi]